MGLLLYKLPSLLSLCNFYRLVAVHAAKFPCYCKDENGKLNYYSTFLTIGKSEI